MNESCDKARATVQDRIDGQLVEGADLRFMERHLASCEGCRGFRSDMEELHQGLATLPELEFPEDALEEVWEQTVRKPVPGPIRWRWLAAAAAVLAVVLAGSLFGPWNGEPEYSPEQVARATAEARAALGLVGQALQRSEDVAMERVLGGRLGPALDRITIGLPEAGSGGKRRTGT